MIKTTADENAPLESKLEKEFFRFDFFQAVRVLNLIARQRSPRELPAGVGGQSMPREEIIRFRAQPSLTFPASSIISYQPSHQSNDDITRSRRREMVVSFFGLTGPNGVLPRHYTQLIIDRTRHKDFALRDFLDLFNHRLVSLFYRAWEKYRFPIAYESFAYGGRRPKDKDHDVFTNCLYCLTGLQTLGLQERLRVPDEAFLYYGGHFAHFPRNAVSLNSIIVDYFAVPSFILQYVGQWLCLAEDDQTQMPGESHANGLNNQLGTTALVGNRVWNIECKFRVQLGPLSYWQFVQFMPSGSAFSPLGQLVRSYVGPDLDFDIQPVLRADEVPPCRLGGEGDPSRLGWNTWLHRDGWIRDADDAVFVNEGMPN